MLITKKDRSFILLIISFILIIYSISPLASLIKSSYHHQNHKILIQEKYWINVNEKPEKRNLKSRLILLSFFTDQNLIERLLDSENLKNKFDNADVGGFKEKTQLGIDVTQELLSDPLNWASALLIPWTGGTSIAAKAAGGEAAKQSLKEATKLGIRKSLGKVILNTPGQVLKSPLSTKQLLGLSSAEGMLYAGTHNYVNQSIDLNTGVRDERSYLETVSSAGIGAVAAPAVVAGFKSVGQIPKWVNSVNEQRHYLKPPIHQTLWDLLSQIQLVLKLAFGKQILLFSF